MHRRVIVALAATVALLGGVLSHAGYACAAGAHVASEPASHAAHSPCAPSPHRAPPCCRDAASISVLPPRPAHQEAPTSRVPPLALGHAIIAAPPSDPRVASMARPRGPSRSPCRLRTHLFLETLLI